MCVIKVDLFLTNNYLIIFVDKLFPTLIYIYIQELMTKKKKSPQPTEEIQMACNKDIMVITGINMKYLSLKEKRIWP